MRLVFTEESGRRFSVPFKKGEEREAEEAAKMLLEDYESIVAFEIVND